MYIYRESNSTRFKLGKQRRYAVYFFDEEAASTAALLSRRQRDDASARKCTPWLVCCPAWLDSHSSALSVSQKILLA